MKVPTMVLVCLLCSCLHGAAAEALLVSLSPHEVEEALRQGREKGDQVAEYVNRIYGFGKEDRHGENGIIRTKWSKLVVLSGLLAARGGKPSEEDLNGIITSTDLQIDIHAFGDRMGFALDRGSRWLARPWRSRPATTSSPDSPTMPGRKVWLRDELVHAGERDVPGTNVWLPTVDWDLTVSLANHTNFLGVPERDRDSGVWHGNQPRRAVHGPDRYKRV